eukprot:768522-Hanusia_phi.AAC.6
MGAKLIEEAGFKAAFFSGFAFSASRLGMPDVGVATYSEMADAGRDVCQAVTIPVVGDGDTGYGGTLNVRRTVKGFARAGFAAVSIEDQCFPKRCAYANGVQVVGLEEAQERIRAAIRARDESRDDGYDILLIARTDRLKVKDARPREEVSWNRTHS